MNKYTREDIFRMVEEEDVGFIRLQFTDIFGTLKNVAVTISQLEKALNHQCMFDGSSIEGFARIEQSDMYLHPDLNTFEIFPWRPQQGKVARLICDIYKPDGTAFESDPRHILKKVVEDAKTEGYEFNVGPECEFFLFETDENGLPTTVTHENASYFDLGPLDFGENARRDMVLTLEDMGFEIEASHHEASPAQHEIDFRYDEALVTADNLMTFKMVVKTIAKRHGLHATFMPKPIYQEAGNGMHVHMLLRKDGKPVFYDKEGYSGLSRTAHYFIGGLLKHVASLCAFTNPSTNSFKRLVPGFEAPVTVGYATSNRSAVIRIPAYAKSPDTKRFELRNPDATCNPYYAYAAILMAGIDGVLNKIDPSACGWGPYDFNLYDLSDDEKARIESLPRTLEEALDALEVDHDYLTAGGVFPERLIEIWIDRKRREALELSQIPTPAEFGKYFNL